MDPNELGVNVRSWIQSDQDRDYWRALEPQSSVTYEIIQPVLYIFGNSLNF